MTVTTSLIRRELGTLSPPLQAKVANKLRKLFGCASNALDEVVGRMINVRTHLIER